MKIEDEIESLRAELRSLKGDFIDLYKRLLDRVEVLEGDRGYVAFALVGPDGKYWAADITTVSGFEKLARNNPAIQRLSNPTTSEQASAIAAHVEAMANAEAGEA